MKLEIRSRYNAEMFLCHEPWACISIATYENDWPEINDENRLGLLRLAFKGKESRKDERFSAQHARDILDFYDEMKAEGAKVLMIHCEMGISRSAGVAAALSQIYEGNDDYYFSSKTEYDPNSYIYKNLLVVNLRKQSETH